MKQQQEILTDNHHKQLYEHVFILFINIHIRRTNKKQDNEATLLTRKTRIRSTLQTRTRSNLQATSLYKQLRQQSEETKEF